MLFKKSRKVQNLSFSWSIMSQNVIFEYKHFFARLCARCAIFLLKIKQIPFSCRLVKGFTFLKRDQSQFKMLLSWQVLSQQREMRIYWWLCNNSEIHLRLWKVWSLVVCSQSSFYVTEARKDEKKQTKRAFSLLIKDELGIQQTIVTKCPISINQI